MSSTLALRSHTPFTVPIASSHPILRKSSIFSTISSTLTLTLGPDPSLHYGPSLRRGRRPPPETTPASESGDGTIERARFSRAFDVAALRVPAEDCSTLESRLRGHLLNWPRIRNVARVPGDDLEPEFKRIMRDAAGDGGERLNSLALRGSGGLHSDGEMEVLSPVLYRDKLAKDFNCRGFVRFRNLAKISRPKSKKKKSNEGESEGSRVKERVGNNDLYLVEVVGDGGAGEEEDLSGLLGDDFQGGSWRGPTRLLLLDERYAKKGVEELPEAVKAVFQDVNRQSSPRLSELVQCRLILFYNYWQMNELLEDMLPEDMVVPTGFETVGHIAHLNLRDEHLPYKKLIAQVILDKNKPKIQTVVNKTDAIQNDYRTMQLEILVGNHSLVTTVIENGIHFQVDLATVYWNSRLATERQRLINCFASSDVVCDVFSGVGPVAISAAKKVKHVFANDLNPSAVEYLERNIVHNKLERKIEVFNMEGRRFIGSMFAVQRPYYSITQVVMNLPSEAAEFLDAFRGIFRKRSSGNSCTLPKIHVYGFSKAQNPEFDFHERINMALGEEVVGIEMRRVRLVAPGKWMLCASFILPQAVAFAKPRGH